MWNFQDVFLIELSLSVNLKLVSAFHSSYVIFDEQLNITSRKSSGPP